MTKFELQDMIDEMVQEEIQKKQLENYRFNNDDYNILKEAIFTTFLEENDIVYDNDYILEGANIDSLAAFRSGKKKFKNAVKKLKIYYKQKDKSKAKKAIKEAENVLNDTEKAIRNTKSDFGSVVLGVMLVYIKTYCQTLVTTSLAVVGIAGGTWGNNGPALLAGVSLWYGNIINLIIKKIRILTRCIEECSNKDNDIMDKINIYKYYLFSAIKDMRTLLKILEKKVDKMEDLS